MDLPNTSGIYLIIREDHIYIGQAQNIKYRIRKHFEMLRANTHKNKHLQSAFNHYGEQNFSVIVLNECPVYELDTYEQEWLDLLREYPKEYVYNQCFTPNTTRGYKFTAQQRKEQSARLKGIKKPKDFGAKVSELNKIKWSSGVMKSKPRKEFMLVSPDGVIHQVKGLSHFAAYHNLNAGALHGVITGKHTQHKLWKSFPSY